MQAVRQCSVCVSRAGGLLRGQTDFSNSIVFRTRAACSRFLRCETCSLVVLQQVENLSQDSLIRRAASVVTDSSSTFLSQTTLALTEALANYAKAVHSRIAFQRRYLASLGKLTAAEEDMLLQVVHGWRAEVRVRCPQLDDCKRYESTWITAVNLCKNAAESAENSGAQQASLSMRTSIQVAQSQVEEARKLSADADKKLAETKVEEIQRKAEYAAFNSEEFEIHEAYLRED
uniref:Direct IAP-binding protein with low pI n=1 Tax=Salarias fasciatus TaxID=181472 RepID=A0A672GQZ0_SALFA